MLIKTGTLVGSNSLGTPAAGRFRIFDFAAGYGPVWAQKKAGFREETGLRAWQAPGSEYYFIRVQDCDLPMREKPM